jgi:hypothetical protein
MSEPSSLKNFELVLWERNSQGQTTNKKKSYACDRAYDLWRFYIRNSSITQNRKRKQHIPNAKEAAKILAETITKTNNTLEELNTSVKETTSILNQFGRTIGKNIISDDTIIVAASVIEPLVKKLNK